MKSFNLVLGLAKYKVKFKKKVTSNNQPVEGVCYFDKKEIQVDSGSTPDVQMTTFWHEWFHAILHELGAPELAQNEAFVESLSQNLARTLKEVPPEVK